MSLLEICTETISGVRAASAGGAQRIELCSALDFDGLSPSEEFFIAAREATDLEIVVLVRPKPGNFQVDATTLAEMCAQIARFHDLGADGIVCGCLTADRQIDLASLQELLRAADSLPLTFHRAFDLVADPITCLDLLIHHKVQRVLTAGGAATAMEGQQCLAELVRRAGRRIEIVVGGSVRIDNIRQLQERTGAGSFHSALDREPTVESVRQLATA